MIKESEINISGLSEEEKEVVFFLNKVGKCMNGNIFKALNISYVRGAEAILSLTKKGFIQYVGMTSYYELVNK